MDFSNLAATEKLQQQLAFIHEIDKVKNIFRQTYLLDANRKENDAEHSWHLAVMAMLLAEHANTDIDAFHVVRMVLIHDLVEIDAGDVYCYDDAGYVEKEKREREAADRIFAMLPDEQAHDIRALWDEFETMETPESQFAAALDRLQPLMHNYLTGGQSWKEHGIRRELVVERNGHIAKGSKVLWDFALSMIDDAVEKGYLAP